MPLTHLSVADAKARFGAVLDGVLHRDERYVIERHGRPVAAIVSLRDLHRLERQQPNGGAGAMALVGLWYGVPEDEVDALVVRMRATRGGSSSRSEGMLR